MRPCGEGVPQKRPDPVYKKPVKGYGHWDSQGRPGQLPGVRVLQQDQIYHRKGGGAVLGRMALGAALAMFVFCANSAVVRAGDDDEDRSTIDKVMHGLGFKSPFEGSSINYGERSPLVVPPTRNLPPPEEEKTPAANWPKDPDINRRAEAKAKANVKRTKPNPDWALESDRVLRPDELDKGPRTTSSTPATPNANTYQSNPAYVDPNKKSFFSSMSSMFKKEEYATFTGEPERGSLTDPPPGYLTPSPDQPYGVAPEHKGYKAPTLEERVDATS